jgi:aldehyde dehydrogenase (NAD+)
MSRHFPHSREFYVNGRWTLPAGLSTGFDILNPSDESKLATLSLGDQQDVNCAVDAAKQALTRYSVTSIAERIELLYNISDIYQKRYNDMAEAISLEMGAPLKFSKHGQAACGSGHLHATIEALKHYTFTHRHSNAQIIKEPVGVCALITPWNWPINQITCKVAPALACGCTCVLKPSELAPLSALLFAEILDEAGTPAGVFNLINGTGDEVGQALCAHADVDMVSFTGSTRAGIEVAQTAALGVKRVTQELGGKAPYIILPDIQSGADFKNAVTDCCKQLFLNSGQSCNAPSRLLVPHNLQKEAAQIALKYANTRVIGLALMPNINTGPVVSQTQYDNNQSLIQAGIDEGATLICGGVGKPNGLSKGYFVQPTVFADVNNTMQIAQEEIFGPVLCIIPYHDETEAIALANDTPYGLAAYIYGNDIVRAQTIAALLRVGMVHINGADNDFDLPFGGYKQSGNGREWGKYGFEDYLETKAIMGYR